MSNSQSDTVNNVLLAPLFESLEQAHSRRKCPHVTDREWLSMTVDRVLAQEPSGRGYLQHYLDHHQRCIPKSTYFDGNNTIRRLTLLQEVSHNVGKMLDTSSRALSKDPFALVASLKDYYIFAGDGHYVESATHDQRIEGKKYAVGHFFGLNMRTHSLFSMALGKKGNGRKHEHDMHTLKRLTIDELRRGTPRGRKTLWVWDRAGIDAPQWQKWKQGSGIYFISRTKENMTLTVLGNFPFDKADPLNSGVISFTLVSVASQALRCVRYLCPVTGVEYSFLSSLTEIEPGVIAALYKARWDIEKVFDETKTKMREKKSWGTSTTAKMIQAEAVAVAHNLMVLFEHRLEDEHELTPKDDEKRRSNRCAQVIAKVTSLGRTISPLIQSVARRATQRGYRFIRWLRNHIMHKTSLSAAIPNLRYLWGAK